MTFVDAAGNVCVCVCVKEVNTSCSGIQIQYADLRESSLRHCHHMVDLDFMISGFPECHAHKLG